MQKTENTKQVSLVDYLKSAAHHSKKNDKKNETNTSDTLIDCEVPGDSYYTQFADEEQETEKLFSKE